MNIGAWNRNVTGLPWLQRRTTQQPILTLPKAVLIPGIKIQVMDPGQNQNLTNIIQLNLKWSFAEFFQGLIASTQMKTSSITVKQMQLLVSTDPPNRRRTDIHTLITQRLGEKKTQKNTPSNHQKGQNLWWGSKSSRQRKSPAAYVPIHPILSLTQHILSLSSPVVSPSVIFCDLVHWACENENVGQIK